MEAVMPLKEIAKPRAEAAMRSITMKLAAVTLVTVAALTMADTATAGTDNPNAGSRPFRARNACGSADGSIIWTSNLLKVAGHIKDYETNHNSRTHVFVKWHDAMIGDRNELVASIPSHAEHNFEPPGILTANPSRAVVTVCSNSCGGGWKCAHRLKNSLASPTDHLG
jgi:hypothetical protein